MLISWNPDKIIAAVNEMSWESIARGTLLLDDVVDVVARLRVSDCILQRL